MIDYNDIRSPFDAFIKDMRTGLKREIRKQSNTGRRSYTSNTIATGLLYRSLRTVTRTAPGELRIDVLGTRYWREADGGTQPDTPAPALGDLQRWATAKGVLLSPRYLRYKLVRYGANRPFSRFATDATPAFIRRLENVMPGAIFDDLANDVSGIIERTQNEID